MDISVVIPVWNDPIGLKRLLAQIKGLDIFSEVIVVEDAAEEGKSSVPQDTLGLKKFKYIRVPEHRGAGYARNMGLQQVTSSHVIFFDSDDLFRDGIKEIIAALQKHEQSSTGHNVPFDFCIFRHHDSRNDAQGIIGSFPDDEARWAKVKATKTLHWLSRTDAIELCQLAAYPWNKIYRTGFLRANNIKCTEIPVHNDVELHWSTFVLAQNILYTSIPGATHFVQDKGGRLTNRLGPERLEVFRAFHNVLAHMRRPAEQLHFTVPFMAFCHKLFKWIENNLDPQYRSTLHTMAGKFFIEHISIEQMTLLAYRDPALASRIKKTIVENWQ